MSRGKSAELTEVSELCVRCKKLLNDFAAHNNYQLKDIDISL